MSTTSQAKIPLQDDQLCQGDIYKQVKYNYIESEDKDGVNIIEMEFPHAIIISQACDVIAMSEFESIKKGKATKYMPSILLCPIYDQALLKDGKHLDELEKEFEFKFIQTQDEKIYNSNDLNIVKKDWHYRFHLLTIQQEEKKVMENVIIDFKHYFTVSPNYLWKNRRNRIMRLEDIYAEQITLKFATYLSRVAMPDE